MTEAELIMALEDEIDLLQTVIAGMVKAAGGEIRISVESQWDPPKIEADDDAITGEWIYRLAGQ